MLNQSTSHLYMSSILMMKKKALHIATCVTLFILTTCLGVPTAQATDVQYPRYLSIIACEVIEMVWVVSDKGASRIRIDQVTEKDTVLPRKYSHWVDYEWNIVDGKLDCKVDIEEMQEVSDLEKPLDAPKGDLSGYLQCRHASMSYAPKYMQKNPGWGVFGAGCPNPKYHDNNTPDDTSDDIIVGYQMPGCPSDLNGIEINCEFTEQGI